MSAWIKTIPEKEAEGALAEAYDDIVRKRGKLSNIMQVHSLRPAAMRSHMRLYLDLMFSQSGLSRVERELIAVVVSAINRCGYCIHHHAEAVNAYWKDRRRVESIIKDYRSADLSDREMAMLKYAEKVTAHPSSTSKGDIAALRSAGFRDADILDINLITAYFNFANRITSGLGVGFSEEEAHGYSY